MVDVYKLIDIWYFLSTLLLAMINFSFLYEKIDENKDNKNFGQKDIKWVSLDNDTNDWGWVDDQI